MTPAPPFVLLHGGRHGGWCWARVAPILRAAGHEVHTPTLTGLGERAHLLTRDVGLDTHVQDLVAVFEYEDIRDAVLVAHSYGGFVAAGAMERIADRVRRLVLVDALFPKTGERVIELVDPALMQPAREAVDRDGEGWYVPVSDASYYGVTDPGDIAWVNAKMTPHPYKAYTDPSGPVDRAWRHPGLFLECRPSELTPQLLARMRERSENGSDFAYRAIDAAHAVMVTEPQRLAEILLEAAGD